MMERHQTAQELQSTLYRAYLIGEMAVYLRRPESDQHALRQDRESVDKDDIQRVAKTYLTEENRTVVTTLPKPKAESAKAGN